MSVLSCELYSTYRQLLARTVYVRPRVLARLRIDFHFYMRKVCRRQLVSRTTRGAPLPCKQHFKYRGGIPRTVYLHELHVHAGWNLL